MKRENDIRLRIMNRLCAGRGCNQKAMLHLLVRFINKPGCFCEQCGRELLSYDLATELNTRIDGVSPRVSEG